MSVPFDLTTVARDLARSQAVPQRAVVGVLADAPLRFAISPPLDLLFDELIGFDAPAGWAAVAVVADVAGARPGDGPGWPVGRGTMPPPPPPAVTGPSRSHPARAR